MAVTQKDIAEKLGVSQRLVSYALNGQNGVGDEMRRKIQEAAEAVGYRPNRGAQALVTGRTYQIALCFPFFLGSSFYNEIIREFEILTRHTPYDLLMVTVDPSSKTGNLIQFSADGVIFVGSSESLPADIAQPAVAIQNQVRVEPSEKSRKLDRVQFNIRQASLDAVDCLLNQGYRRIAYVAPDDMLGDFEWRCHAYQAKMHVAGLAEEIIALPIRNEEQIRQQSHRMLTDYFNEKGFPDALFCCNDDIAMGAYRALGELGRRIPDEAAVIGFDDLDYANYLNPPMSSVHMPIEDACKAAWEMLMQRIEDKTLPPQFKAIEAHLVMRESSLKQSR